MAKIIWSSARQNGKSNLTMLETMKKLGLIEGEIKVGFSPINIEEEYQEEEEVRPEVEEKPFI